MNVTLLALEMETGTEGGNEALEKWKMHENRVSLPPELPREHLNFCLGKPISDVCPPDP